MKWLNITHLRKKSKAVKEQIALSVAGICTALVFTVWVMADPAGVSTIVVEDEQPGPFAGLLAQVREQIAGVRAAITSSDTPATTTPVVIPDLTPPPTRTMQTESQVTDQEATSSQSARGVRLISAPASTTSVPSTAE